jgi:hypothetical protein
MFVVGMVAGLIGQSSGLIADSLDMFADAVAYRIALSAFNRGTAFEARAAMASGGCCWYLVSAFYWMLSAEESLAALQRAAS